MAKKIFLVLSLFYAAVIPAEAAFRFGLANGAAKRAAIVMEEAIPSNPIMILPILPLQSVTTGQVIWPFGIQGGGHPNGHPGIDFQTRIGASVLATATAKVWKIEDDYTDGALQKLVMLETASYQIVYVGSLINLSIAPGDIVTKGQKIADLGQFALVSQPYGFVHWGINSRAEQAALCPYDLLDLDSKLRLDDLFSLTTYSEQNLFPLICNPCPPGGCR